MKIHLNDLTARKLSIHKYILQAHTVLFALGVNWKVNARTLCTC